jgi:hypothetical protein
MDRQSANALRILGIVVTSIVVIALSLTMLYLGFFIVLMGGLSQRTRILHPRAANSFYGLILLVIATVTAGIIIIGRLATGIVKVRGAAAAQPGPPPAHIEPSGSASVSRSLALHLSPAARKTIERLALAIAAGIAVSSITWFQIASRYAPRRLIFLPPFILSEAPDAILIYFLLKRPSRRSFTFLIAMLIFPILQTLFNPRFLIPYRHIYTNASMGSLWLALAGLIYIVTVVLAYKAIHQTGLMPQPSWIILATVAAFFYFFFVREITPYLYSLWT